MHHVLERLVYLTRERLDVVLAAMDRRIVRYVVSNELSWVSGTKFNTNIDWNLFLPAHERTSCRVFRTGEGRQNPFIAWLTSRFVECSSQTAEQPIAPDANARLLNLFYPRSKTPYFREHAAIVSDEYCTNNADQNGNDTGLRANNPNERDGNHTKPSEPNCFHGFSPLFNHPDLPDEVQDLPRCLHHKPCKY